MNLNRLLNRKIILMRYFIYTVLCTLYLGFASAQIPGYWQQQVDYTMVIDMDVKDNQFDGRQTLVYTNNSPDTLYRVFYHLYYNAFQPGSMMDVRSRTIADPDSRVGDRIFKLKDDQIGYQKIKSLEQTGHQLDYEIQGTILDVELADPILPGHSTTFEMRFEAQIPLQIRRTGRDNAEDIRYSMSQWYPKICEYDESGWHPEPYIGREFYSVWGDFDVTIHIDEDYVIGGTGELQETDNYKQHGSNGSSQNNKSGKSWHFLAENVPDFVWAADPDYTYHSEKAANDVKMEFYYQPGEPTKAWASLPNIMSEVFEYADKHFGPYPYDKYAFIQAGDGGMEYPMATLITGHRPLTSLVGVSVHELMHSWYQLVLSTNESLYAWMDEGFTSYASSRIMNHLRQKNLIPGEYSEKLFASSRKSYIRLVESGLEEPLTTHADHFHTNFAYSIASYTKGSLFLNQLEYIVGKEVFDRAMLRYFDTWKFKHPTDQDFIRIFEKESGMVLDWYLQYWVKSVKWIDYSIEDVTNSRKGVEVQLSKNGLMPMPIDVYVTTKNGEMQVYSIPLVMMRNVKPSDGDLHLLHQEPWPWVNPQYTLRLDDSVKLDGIEKIEIDSSGRLVDVDDKNNTWLPSSEP